MEFFASVLLYFTTINDGPLPLRFASLLEKRGHHISSHQIFVCSRHKDQCPDLGALLVLFTVLQGDASCPKREDFLNHYVDENSLRWVMWWQRSGTKPEGVPVFQATQVSREILMFQMTVIEVVIGDVPTTLQVGWLVEGMISFFWH